MRATVRRWLQGFARLRSLAPASQVSDTTRTTELVPPDRTRTGHVLDSGSISLRALTRSRSRSRARLDPQSKRFLRRGRDANIDALMLRRALSRVNENGGLFALLNPIKAPINCGRREIKDVEQKYQLIEVVRDLLAVGFTDQEIDCLADEARRAAAELSNTREDAAFFAVHHFLSHARIRVMHRARGYRTLRRPADVDDEMARRISARLSRVRWIEAELESAHPRGAPTGTYKRDLTAILRLGSGERVLEALDRRFEAVMTRALKHDLVPATLTHLKTVRFMKHGPDQVAPNAGLTRLRKKHPVRRALGQLQKRLDRGERSAVGGSDYATQTFPEGILAAAAAKELKVIAFDGSTEDGLDYIRSRYGTGRAGRQGCRVMGLEGIYGSHPRSIVTLDDGQQFLLVSGLGQSRQLNNAAMLLLYEGSEGRIRAEDIELASDGRDLVEVLRGDLQRLLRAEEAAEPNPVPTRLMILQNPRHLEQALGERIRWSEQQHDTRLPIRVGYVTKKDGSTERIIAPKVGGGGVYGDNAGAFVKAFFTAGVSETVPDVIFNGAAGGFAGTGQLPDVSPGGLIAPQQQIAEHDGGVYPLQTLLNKEGEWPPGVRAAVEKAGVHLTDRHVAVAAPSIETYALIRDLVDEGNASIDVEGASIAKAVLELREAGHPVTFTPVYTHSDDPRRSEGDRFESLAMRGPLFEGSRFNPALFAVLTALAGFDD